MMDNPFPRGKGRATDAKSTATAASQDALFGTKRLRNIEVATPKSSKKRRKDPNVNLLATTLPEVGLGMAKSSGNSKVVKIETLTFNKYPVGAMALGVVLQVHENNVIVSLPGGVTGVVYHNEVSDVCAKQEHNNETMTPITDLLAPQQIVRCFVLSTSITSRKVLTLSLRASHLHRHLTLKQLTPGFPIVGSVASIEDHGYVISCGIQSLNGFLPFSNLPPSHTPFAIGQPVESIIESINATTHTVTLKSTSSAVRKAVVSNKLLSFVSLVPNMLVSAIVTKVAANGLLVTFLNIFHGVIDVYSLPNPVSDNWQSEYEVNTVIKARIVYVDHGNKSVRLSMKPHIIDMKGPTHLPALGEIVEGATVCSVVKNTGVYLSTNIPIDEEEVDAPKKSKKMNPNFNLFLHRSSLEHGENFEKHYHIGLNVKARLTGYHAVEGVCIASDQDLVLKNEIIHSTQLQLGQEVQCQIQKIANFGMVVMINKKIRALCPLLHCADQMNNMVMLKKYKVGQIIKMKVWELNQNKVIVSNKQPIIAAKTSPAYDSLSIGSVVTGVIGNMNEKGISVHYYMTKGTVSMAVLVQQGVLNVAESYFVGQSVEVVVINKYDGRLNFALNIGDTSSLLHHKSTPVKSLSAATAPSLSQLSGVIVKMEASQCLVHMSTNQTAVLHEDHIADDAAFSRQLFRKMKVGQSLSHLVVLSSHSDATMVTMKPLLLSTTTTNNLLPSMISDLSPGQTVVGYIHKIESYGILVRFMNNLTAIIPRINILEKGDSSKFADSFTVGSSLRAMVQRVDLKAEKIILTLKQQLIEVLYGEHNYCSTLLHSQHLLHPESYPAVGSVVTATVSEIKDYGMILMGASNAVFLAVEHPSTPVNSSVQVLVLDVDYEKSVCYVSFNTKVKSKTAKHHQVLEGDVVLLREKYAVCSTKSGLSFVQVADYHCPYKTASFAMHEKVSLTVIHTNHDVGTPHDNIIISVPTSLITRHEQNKQQLTSLQQQAMTSDSMLLSNISLNGETSEALLRKFLEHLKVNQVLQWNIKAIHEMELVLEPIVNGTAIQTAVTALVHISSLSPVVTDLKTILSQHKKHKNASLSPMHPFSSFEVGETVSGKILHVRNNAKDNAIVTYVSILTNVDTSAKILQWKSKHSVKANHAYDAYVSHVGETECTVSLSPYVSAPLQYMDVSSDIKVVQLFKKHAFVGCPITVVVTAVDATKHHLLLNRSLIENMLPCSGPVQAASPPTVDAGDIIHGVVDLHSRHVASQPAVAVHLGNGLRGHITLPEFADRPSDATDIHTASEYCGVKHGELVKCIVLENKGIASLSLRASRLESRNFKADPLPLSGSIVPCFVINTTQKGCFVRITSSYTGRILIKNLSDNYVESPEQQFPAGKLLHGRIVSVQNTSTSHEDNKVLIELTLKHSAVAGDDKQKELEQLEKGSVVVGTVKNVTDFGVFVAIKGTNLVGLCRKYAAVSGDENVYDAYATGDIVQAKVLGVSNGKISLGLKSSCFEEEDDAMSVEGSDVEEEESEDESSDEDSVDAMIAAAALHSDDEEEEPDSDEEEEADSGAEEEVESDEVSGSDEDGDEENDDSEEMEYDSNDDGEEVTAEPIKNSKPSSKPVVKPTVKAVVKKSQPVVTSTDAADVVFDWEAPAAPENDDDAMELSSEDEGPSSKRHRNKDKETRREEEAIREKELEALEPTMSKPADFERALLAEPNNSMLWIDYMTHYTRSTDIDTARRVAERALKTINFREEDEKYNIWVAWLNLEYQYGSMNKLEEVFKRAIQESKSKYIHLHMAELYEAHNDHAGTVEMFEKAIKKHKTKKKVWIALQKYHIKQGNVAQAKASLSRSMKSLSKHKHVEVLLTYAANEYQYGLLDHGREIYEDLLATYPKRSDIWHVYVDKEIKYLHTKNTTNHLNYIRNLFERMIVSKLSVKCMKTVFKKYITFELDYGTEELVNSVKEKAAEYVSML